MNGYVDQHMCDCIQTFSMHRLSMTMQAEKYFKISIKSILILLLMQECRF